MNEPKNNPVTITELPGGPGQPNWKPWVYNPLYLLFLVGLHVLHIVGIQLLANRHASDSPELDRILANQTVTQPQSLFVFEEDDMISFILWVYLPVTVMLVVAAFWEPLDLAIRHLEPFRQLSSREGGNVFNALCLNYTSTFGLFTPFRAIARRHYAVFLSAVSFILTAIVLPAITGVIFSIEWGSLSFSVGKTSGPKYAVITMSPDIAAAVQALHGLLVAILVALGVVLHTRRTGLYRDPKGLAGLATFISDADRTGLSTLSLLQQIPSFAHSSSITSALQGITFRLAHFSVYNADGSVSRTYQLAAESRAGYIPAVGQQSYQFHGQRTDATGFWLRKRMAWFAEFVIWIGQASVIAAIYYVARFSGLGTSRIIISKVIVTLFITVGGMMWMSIQRSLQTIEPWRQLSDGRSQMLHKSVLTRHNVSNLGVLGSAWLSIMRGSLIMLWAAFCVIMIHTITVFVPPLLELGNAAGLDSSMAQEEREIGVLSGTRGMTLVCAGVIFQIIIFLNLIFLTISGRTRPVMPRAPSTIASQLLYLCRSDRLLSSYSGTSTLSGRQLDERLKFVDSRCMFGWFWWHRGQQEYVGLEEHHEGEHWRQFDFTHGINY
ncbi:hypothetical protein S7711_06223 [Stachybotrys chartarum IBT 7711]|uniref:Uncharacterized protein n=1 Tax=Stachybotrys chartarum (strain CBS 109288 / IBT 7711) TaxID=1280523 RepID=A0A084AWB5_STACB|nr:hypothetical protein S7711_06223 [Stachybotrys chartarum IBT 7711]